jgi:formate-dependent phosphoribosylglycinamide formyltransferase (GAR transformylase)
MLGNQLHSNEIMVAPLAYADVFVSKDKGIRNLLRNTNKQPLARAKYQYCDSLTELEKWLAENVA